jgi:hypothetical protein
MPKLFPIAALLIAVSSATGSASAQDGWDANESVVAQYKLVCLDSATVQDFQGPFEDQINWQNFPNEKIPAVVVGIIAQVRGKSPFDDKPYTSYKASVALYDPKLFGKERIAVKMSPAAFGTLNGSTMEFDFAIPGAQNPAPFGGDSGANYTYGTARFKFGKRKKNNLPISTVAVIKGSYETAHRLYCHAEALKEAAK